MERRARRLYTREDIKALCEAAFKTRTDEDGKTVPVTKNGQEFVDYIRLLSLTGAREQEAIKVCWDDVDLVRKLITIGRMPTPKTESADMWTSTRTWRRT